jgi:two-component system cell cycle sensor histidine kinase/response regulator CckA
MLTKMGYNVLIARNGKHAIEIYKENRDKIDIAIIDMIMPGLSGGETYDRLKEINADINVLLSSGHNINGQSGEIIERDRKGFIQKPFNIEALSIKLREVLDKK